MGNVYSVIKKLLHHSAQHFFEQAIIEWLPLTCLTTY